MCYTNEVVRNDNGKLNQLVSMTLRVHPFPYRTRKLSSIVPKILGGRLPGKIGRCQHQNNRPIGRLFYFIHYCPIVRTIRQFIFSKYDYNNNTSFYAELYDRTIYVIYPTKSEIKNNESSSSQLTATSLLTVPHRAIMNYSRCFGIFEDFGL